MYKNKYSEEFRDEDRYVKSWAIWLIGFLFATSLVGWVFSRSLQTLDTAILRYEDFQEIYNTCQKINADLATIQAISEDDKMFSAFSKNAQIAAKKQQLTRWIEEYNAKSRMWNRSLWKSNSLPYQLSVGDFKNYNK